MFIELAWWEILLSIVAALSFGVILLYPLYEELNEFERLCETAVKYCEEIDKYCNTIKETLSVIEESNEKDLGTFKDDEK